jgi:hypothetical protein
MSESQSRLPASSQPSVSPAPVDAPPPRAIRKAAVPRVLPSTLMQLYSEPKTRPLDLLRYLAQRDMFITSPEDQDWAQAQLPLADPDLIKTRALAIEVANSFEGRFVGAFSSFLMRCIEAELASLPPWPISEGGSARQLWNEWLDANRPVLGTRRKLNVLFILQSVLSARFGLTVADALLDLAQAFAPRSNRIRRPPTAIGQAPLGVPMLKLWVSALAPYLEEGQQSRRRADQAEATAEELHKEIADLGNRFMDASREIDKLGASLKNAEEELRGMTLAKQIEQSQLRDSMSAFLSAEVTNQLKAAEEGLALEPPRVAHAIERLDDIHHAINRKVQWLKSSG